LGREVDKNVGRQRFGLAPIARLSQLTFEGDRFRLSITTAKHSTGRGDFYHRSEVCDH